MRTYQQTINYLYQRLPMYQRQGPAAYRPDLGNIVALAEALGNPHLGFKSVHVAGTNGKGSTCNMLAAAFQLAGYRTGLYTSPHLKDFRERIRINGVPIAEKDVVAFVETKSATYEQLNASFFEVTTAMAFWYFAQQQVDIAIIEVGLGGRLDSTNIIQPAVSVITSIAEDHKAILGDTLPAIAAEKAGIIKPATPVVLGQYQHQVTEVLEAKAAAQRAEVIHAYVDFSLEALEGGYLQIRHKNEALGKAFIPALKGKHQQHNLLAVAATAHKCEQLGFKNLVAVLPEALAETPAITGLKGRWQQLNEQPAIFADVAHNPAAIEALVQQLESYSYSRLFIVIGMVADKEAEEVLLLLPASAHYIFCQPKNERALAAETLAAKGAKHNRTGRVVPEVNNALAEAKKQAKPTDIIIICGSNFLIAELNEL